MQAPRLSELGVRGGGHPSGGSLKNWGAKNGVQTLSLPGKSWELEVPAVC